MALIILYTQIGSVCIQCLRLVNDYKRVKVLQEWLTINGLARIIRTPRGASCCAGDTVLNQRARSSAG